MRADSSSPQRFFISAVVEVIFFNFFFFNQSTEILVDRECCINTNFICLCLSSAGVQVNHSSQAEKDEGMWG